MEDFMMKKVMVVCVFLLCTAAGIAHENMLTSGREWVYQEMLPDYENMTEEQIKKGEILYKKNIHMLAVGDKTVFDGLACHEIVHRIDGTEVLFGYACEKDGKLYLYALYTGEVAGFSQPINYTKCQWQLLYDFDATIGTPSEMGWMTDGCHLCEIDTIDVKGHKYVRQIWKDTNGWQKCIVDGVGCETGLLFIENITTNGATTMFVECRDKGDSIFTANDFNVGPITNGITTIQTSPRTVSPLYDLQGRRQDTAPRKGIYIQGGKKRVAR